MIIFQIKIVYNKFNDKNAGTLFSLKQYLNEIILLTKFKNKLTCFMYINIMWQEVIWIILDFKT